MYTSSWPPSKTWEFMNYNTLTALILITTQRTGESNILKYMGNLGIVYSSPCSRDNTLGAMRRRESYASFGDHNLHT